MSYCIECSTWARVVSYDIWCRGITRRIIEDTTRSIPDIVGCTSKGTVSWSRTIGPSLIERTRSSCGSDSEIWNSSCCRSGGTRVWEIYTARTAIRIKPTYNLISYTN